MKTCKLEGCEESIEHKRITTMYCKKAHWRLDNRPLPDGHTFYDSSRSNALNITDEEKELIIGMRKDGCTYLEIANKTGRCRASVSNVLNAVDFIKKTGINPKEIAILAEVFVKEYFEDHGLRVEQQPYESPFDLLVNGHEVDVKSRSSMQGDTNTYLFSIDPNGGTSKLRPPKGFYAFVATDTGDIWIIPAKKVEVKCLGITPDGKKYGDYLFAVHQLYNKGAR